MPLIGNVVGWLAARLFKQSYVDAIAIAVETGVQNTGMAMFLITFSLDQPAADITMVIPIAVSIMSPLPLIIFIFVQKCWQ